MAGSSNTSLSPTITSDASRHSTQRLELRLDGLCLDPPSLEALLAFVAVFQAVLKLGDAVLELQVLAEELLPELLGVDQADQFFAPLLKVFDHLRDGLTERLFALVLLPAAPGFDGDAEKGRRTVGALG